MLLFEAPGVAEERTDAAATLARSEILDTRSSFVPGTPVEQQDTAVVVLSCGLRYHEAIGNADQTITYQFTVYNQLDKALRVVTLTYRFDKGNVHTWIYDLSPHELRVVTNVANASSNNATGVLLGAHRPTFFLCGSGPDLATDGTTIEEASMFPRSLPVLRWAVPERGGKPYTPFNTASSVDLTDTSSEVPGLPLQRDAMFEQSSYVPDVPPRNLVPVIITSCGATHVHSALRYTVDVYNQTADNRAQVRVELADGPQTISSVLLSNLRAHEYRAVSWTSSGPRRPALLTCKIATGNN